MSVHRLAQAFFGFDRGEIDILFNEFHRRCFQPIVRVAEVFVAGISSAPEIPSYEEILQEKCGYGRLSAKIMAHQIRRWGANLAAEINEGRKLRASIDRMADVEGQSTLVMSRRAKQLLHQCRSLEARDWIDKAIEKANLPLTADEFRELVELASERDECTGRELTRISRQLSPHLPEKRGRPISEDTCAHLFLLRQLESCGHECAYTSSSDGAGFTDPVTRATQLASGSGGFSPLRANTLRRKGILPPVLRMDLMKAKQSLDAPPSSGRN